MMKKIILLIALTFTLSACNTQKFFMPTMPQPPQHGPTDYRTGWKDGCRSGFTAYGNSFFRSAYQLNINNDYTDNQLYLKGWELGQRYCSYYSNYYLSNKELGNKDMRINNTWHEVSFTDKLFSYKGWTKFDGSFLPGSGTFYRKSYTPNTLSYNLDANGYVKR